MLIVKGIGRFRFSYRPGMENLPVKAARVVYKAENAGGWVRSVTPRNTSQLCGECGCTPGRKLTLADRVYRCGHCGYESDRDVNAARNILQVGLMAGLPDGKSGITPVPAHGKDANHGGSVETVHRAEQHAVNVSM